MPKSGKAPLTNKQKRRAAKKEQKKAQKKAEKQRLKSGVAAPKSPSESAGAGASAVATSATTSIDTRSMSREERAKAQAALSRPEPTPPPAPLELSVEQTAFVKPLDQMHKMRSRTISECKAYFAGDALLCDWLDKFQRLLDQAVLLNMVPQITQAEWLKAGGKLDGYHKDVKRHQDMFDYMVSLMQDLNKLLDSDTLSAETHYLPLLHLVSQFCAEIAEALPQMQKVMVVDAGRTRRHSDYEMAFVNLWLLIEKFDPINDHHRTLGRDDLSKDRVLPGLYFKSNDGIYSFLRQSLDPSPFNFAKALMTFTHELYVNSNPRLNILTEAIKFQRIEEDRFRCFHPGVMTPWAILLEQHKEKLREFAIGGNVFLNTQERLGAIFVFLFDVVLRYRAHEPYDSIGQYLTELDKRTPLDSPEMIVFMIGWMNVLRKEYPLAERYLPWLLTLLEPIFESYRDTLNSTTQVERDELEHSGLIAFLFLQRVSVGLVTPAEVFTMAGADPRTVPFRECLAIATTRAQNTLSLARENGKYKQAVQLFDVIKNSIKRTDKSVAHAGAGSSESPPVEILHDSQLLVDSAQEFKKQKQCAEEACRRLEAQALEAEASLQKQRAAAAKKTPLSWGWCGSFILR